MEDLLNQYYAVKKQLRELRETEKFLKYKIHQTMNHYETNSISSNYFTCIRDIRSREIMYKKDIPQPVWEQYAQRIEFPIILLKKNERRDYY